MRARRARENDATVREEWSALEGARLMPTLFCFGLGYCARHYIAEFGARFDRIAGTSRTPKAARAIVEKLGVFDGGAPSREVASPPLHAATHL